MFLSLDTHIMPRKQDKRWASVSEELKNEEARLVQLTNQLKLNTRHMGHTDPIVASQVLYEVDSFRLSMKTFRQSYRDQLQYAKPKRENACWIFQEALRACVVKTLLVLRYQVSVVSSNNGIGFYGALQILRHLYLNAFDASELTAMKFLFPAYYVDLVASFRRRHVACKNLCYLEMVYIGLADPAPSDVRTQFITEAHFKTMANYFSEICYELELSDPKAMPAWVRKLNFTEAVQPAWLSRLFRSCTVHPTTTIYEMAGTVMKYCCQIIYL